jgi:hypothetical protein
MFLYFLYIYLSKMFLKMEFVQMRRIRADTCQEIGLAKFLEGTTKFWEYLVPAQKPHQNWIDVFVFLFKCKARPMNVCTINSVRLPTLVLAEGTHKFFFRVHPQTLHANNIAYAR